KYLPIKGSSDESPNIITYGYQGILYAVAQGADIINCSWGGTIRSQFGHEVVKYAVSQGVAVVAACGNTGKQNTFYPAGYPEVISVANSKIDDKLLTGIPGGSTYDYSVNVSAPGNFLYGPINDAGYNGNTGTSFASPVAAGAIALVRGYFPQYTGYQAGQRIRVTADPTDSLQPASYAGKVGSGRVNVLRALTDPPKPSIRLRDWVLSTSEGTNVLRQGDTAYLQASWKNHLETANDLIIRVEEVGDSLISNWLIDEWRAGKVSDQEISRYSEPGFSFVLNDSISGSQTLVLKLSYVDEESGYADVEYVKALVNPPFLPVKAAQLETIVSAQANWGYYSTVDDRFGDGFVFRSQQNALAEGGFLVGKSATSLSDNIRNVNYRDRDFNILQNIAEENKENLASFQASSLFSDTLANAPLGLIIKQTIYTFPELPSSIILAYTLSNPNGEKEDSLFAGLFADWDISPSFSQNAAIIDSSKKVTFTQYPVSNVFSNYGISLLSEQDFHAYNAAIGEFSFNKAGKFQALSATIGDTPTVLKNKDVAQFVSAGPFSIDPGSDTTLFFGLVAGQSLEEFYQELSYLQSLYRCYFLENPFPENFLYTPVIPSLGETISLKDPNTQFSERSWFINGEKISEEDSTTYLLNRGGAYNIRLVSGNESCQFTDERELEIQFATSLPEDGKRLFQLYPNPTTGRIKVEGLPRKGSFQLSTLIGEEILDGRLEAGNGEIDLNRLSSGVYLLQIRSAGQTETHKIIKN
ncbi:MAG: S8 family peptidase, partial [Bacteroidota bacterium]